jgi:hypothetical protein
LDSSNLTLIWRLWTRHLAQFSFLLLWSTVYCGSALAESSHPQYALYFDRDGYPIAPKSEITPDCVDSTLSAPHGWAVIRSRRDKAGTNCWDSYEAKIFDGIRKNERRRVLLFIHGGLNSLNDGRHRVDKLVSEGDHPETLLHSYYPIFINWQASLFSSYVDHLFRVRQGRRAPGLAPVTSPYILGKDLAFGAIRILPDTLQLVYDSFETTIPTKQNEVCFEPPAQEPAYMLQQSARACEGRGGLINIDHRWGKDIRTKSRQVFDRVQQVPWLPIKPFSTGFIIDGFGAESWNIMLRRTELMFHHENGDGGDSRTLSEFLKTLLSILQESKIDRLDVVAHSAGAIILNRALKEVPELPVSNIVYMAAASSIEDYESVVLGDGVHSGFMARHPEVNCYHLVLHPHAEVEENALYTFLEPQPRGSLLYWIDAFLAQPQYLRQRTLGRASNLAPIIESTPDSLRTRMHFKVFDYGPPLKKSPNQRDWYSWCDSNRTACQPRHHGDFSEMPFWQSWFWEPNPAPSKNATVNWGAPNAISGRSGPPFP